MWDDEAGYDRDDPKHPDWADAMADRADMQRKRLKEERDEDEFLAGVKRLEEDVHEVAPDAEVVFDTRPIPILEDESE